MTESAKETQAQALPDYLSDCLKEVLHLIEEQEDSGFDLDPRTLYVVLSIFENNAETFGVDLPRFGYGGFDVETWYEQGRPAFELLGPR